MILAQTHLPSRSAGGSCPCANRFGLQGNISFRDLCAIKKGVTENDPCQPALIVIKKSS
jgi:hypothetical protein